MPHNKPLKITLAASLIYFAAGAFVWQPIIADKAYIYEDIRQTIAWSIVMVGIGMTYYHGAKDWQYTIILHVMNLLFFVMLVDSINCAIVYNDCYDSENVLAGYSKANEVLNDGKVYFDLALCGTVWAALNFVFFCIIMPNVPKWLHK